MSPFLPPGGDSVLLLYVLAFLVAAIVWELTLLRPAAYSRRPSKRSATATDSPPPSPVRGRKKPASVRNEIIRLAALHPEGSCRKIAATFCAMQFGVESAGKSWVALLLLTEKYRIQAVRHEIRSRKPPAGPPNTIWALGLSRHGNAQPRAGHP